MVGFHPGFPSHSEETISWFSFLYKDADVEHSKILWICLFWCQVSYVRFIFEDLAWHCRKCNKKNEFWIWNNFRRTHLGKDLLVPKTYRQALLQMAWIYHTGTSGTYNESKNLFLPYDFLQQFPFLQFSSPHLSMNQGSLHWSQGVLAFCTHTGFSMQSGMIPQPAACMPDTLA